MSYYLRFEAVNLGNFIYDTNDLSTIRGGGLLLLDATKKVEIIIKKLDNNSKTITKGASWALFELETDKTIEDIKQDILSKLNADNVFCHATFVVDMIEKTSDYKKDRNSLHSLNRWQQMQAPSLSIPKAANAVCAFDKVRPASVKTYSKDSEVIMLSASVNERKNYGRDQKHGEFYKDKTELDLKFTSDLEELSKDSSQGILNDKIAVIYLDGNKFGKIAGACKKAKEQTKFDTRLREGQDAILKTLLEKAQENSSWIYQGNKIRLETLLWGGDELLWVVPAWLGWFTLNLFFKEAEQKIKFTPEKYPSKDGKLTFAAGLVFCHHNAPIHRVTKLAKQLADNTKGEHECKNLVAYQILESFDHAGTDIEEYRQQRIDKLGQAKDLIIAATDMEKLETYLQTLKDKEFPRRKSYQIIKALKSEDTQQAEHLQEKLLEDTPDIKQSLDDLKTLCGGDNAHWLHLTDLWDYIALKKEDSKHD